MSPLPRGKPSRRGGISAEPVTEEDATSYVKKVRYISWVLQVRVKSSSDSMCRSFSIVWCILTLRAVEIPTEKVVKLCVSGPD